MKSGLKIVLPLLCLVAGVARWLDLINWTSAATGYCIVGSPWLRYGLLFAMVAVFLLAARAAAKVPAAYRRRSVLRAVLCFVCCGLFAVRAGVGASDSLLLGDKAQLVLAILYALTAVWLAAAGAAQLRAVPDAPTNSALMGVAGTAGLLVQTLLQGVSNAAHIAHVGVIWEMFASLAALLFGTALLRACYLPDRNCGRQCAFTGFTAFLLCTCLYLPAGIYSLLIGSGTTQTMLASCSLAAFGLLGLVYAIQALGEEA